MTSVVVSPVSVNARLDAPLSRWLWLLKWLLVLPHVIVLGFLWIAFAVLSIVAFFAILITGRYPWSIFEFNVGVLRWSWRVWQRPPGDYGPSGSSWSAGRATAVVAGSVLVLLGVGAAAGGAAALTADRGARNADGFVTTGARGFTSSGYALLFDPIELHGSGPAADRGALDLDAVLGDVRVRATAAGPGDFVGIGPVDAVAGYLTTVDRDRLIDLRSGQVVQQRLPGGAPATPPAQQTFWVASAAGPGPQQLTWTPTEGRWVVAVMNADGSRPVDVELSAGATLPHLRWLWIGPFVGAALALVVGAVLVVLAVRRRPSV